MADDTNNVAAPDESGVVSAIDETVSTLNEVVSDEQESSEGGEYSPTELRAMQEGWKPKDQDEGDPAEWRDARSFLDRGELLKKISQSNKEAKEMRKAMAAMQEHNRKLAEAKEQEIMSQLKRQKVEALENQDHARVVEIDEALLEAKDRIAAINAQEARNALQESSGQQVHPELAAWIDRNSWYATNPGMRGYADAVGSEYAKENPHKPPSEVLRYVENEVKRAFNVASDRPSKQDRPAAVMSTGTRSASATRASAKGDYKALLASMPEQDKAIMNTLIRGGHITREKYLEDYARINQKGVA